MHRADDPAIDHHMLCRYTACDAAGFTDDQHAGAALTCHDVTDDFTIHTQTVREPQAAFNASALCNQTFNGGLLFFTEHTGVLDVKICSQLEGLHRTGHCALNNLGRDCFYHGL